MRHAWILCALLTFACRPASPESDAPLTRCDDPAYLKPTPGVTPPRLATSGPCIVDPEGRPVVLRGFSIADPDVLERKRGESAPAVFRRAVEEYGASVVRVPIHKETDPGIAGFAEDPEAYAERYLDPLVDLGAEVGSYVILDLHLVADYLPELAYLERSWKFLSERYGSRHHVLFEMFNEPIYPDDWLTWSKQAAEPTLKVLRAAAPETLVIVGGPHWSVHLAEAATAPLSDRLVAYTAHIYPEMTAKVWREEFEPVIAKYPVFVTEWGWDMTSVFPLRGRREDFGVPFAAWLATHNLSWTAWIFDNRWSSTMFDENWRLLGGENHMGEFVKDLLR